MTLTLPLLEDCAVLEASPNTLKGTGGADLVLLKPAVHERSLVLRGEKVPPAPLPHPQAPGPSLGPSPTRAPSLGPTPTRALSLGPSPTFAPSLCLGIMGWDHG